MPVVTLFPGGEVPTIPAGYGYLNLQWMTDDRQNITGASFTVNGQTVTANADGRAAVTVPVGSHVTTCTHTGKYLGDGPQTVVVENQTAYLVLFHGVYDRFHVTVSEPTASDGKVGDFWFVTED